MVHTISDGLFQRAQTTLVGGVNSPVRAFKSVGGNPLFIAAGEGAYVWDVDGNRYIDYIGSWGPLLAGHAHPGIVEKVVDACRRGFTFGAPTEIEIKLAEKICAVYPSIEKIRFVNSGTEATMGAIRAARGFTGKKKILKFEGCYHGHADSFLVKAGSGAATLGIPDSAGVTEAAVVDTVTVPFNDIQAVQSVVEKYRGDIAAVIIEPVVGNMGCVLPEEGFLQSLRGITDQEEIVLIFDEVMTGFRVALGGAQSLFNVTPDMTTLGKIVGGGFPVGAYGGKKEIMEQVAPMGPVYQAGTLSGNPIAMTAGYETVCLLEEEGFYKKLNANVNQFYNSFQEIIAKNRYPLQLQHCGAMFCLYFSERPVHAFGNTEKCDFEKFRQYFWKCLDEGVYFPPSQYEANFISSQHGTDEFDRTLSCIEHALAAVM